MVTGRHLVLVVLAAAPGCELRESIGATDPILVVHAVLNTAVDTQVVLVNWSVSGQSGPDYLAGFPDNPAAAAVGDAEVVLEHRSPPPGCATPTIRLPESAPGNAAVTAPTGIYRTGSWCPIRPGDQVNLIVRVRGRVVTGATTIPGLGTVSVGTRPGESGPDTVLVGRDRDSIWIATAGGTGAAVQYEVARPSGPFASLVPSSGYGGHSLLDAGVFSYITDTTGAVAIPGNQVVTDEDLSEAWDLLQPGRYYQLTVAAADRSYFDFARSTSDRFTGRGFINHLEGGIGVFGSVDPATRILKIVSQRRTPEEGTYRIAGTVDAGPVDLRLELYRGRLPYNEPFSAFVTGTWGGAPLAIGSVDGWFGVSDAFIADSFVVVGDDVASVSFEFIKGTPPDTVRYVVGGRRGPPGQPFSLFAYSGLGGVLVVDSLLAVQETVGDQPGTEIGRVPALIRPTLR